VDFSDHAAVEAAGMQFNRVEDLKAGRAVYQDFTNQMLIERGEDVGLRTAEQAGDVLASIVASTLHVVRILHYGQGRSRAGQGSRPFGFAESRPNDPRVLATIDLTSTTMLLTSDHGNIEDLSTRSHTLNPVPT
jgi:bisphosphoglycerate-independent phosphoglycerate mutase (AlkP superfamily)